MAPRSSKRKRKDDGADAQENPPHSDAQTEEPVQAPPSGHPFIQAEVEWDYQRLNLLDKKHKVIPGGYESMAGDVNAILRYIGNEKGDLVRNSAMGEFTRLNDFSTRSGNMLHFMVCHQVVPKPNFDPTSLFFKIGDTVIRFSREEYALVSGLKFGPSSFDPYAAHELPPNSIYERLFGAREEITTGDVRDAYIDKEFKVNNKKVPASRDDLVKLSKLLLCLGFAMGYDGKKKKIPRWMWVLLEDEKEWEAFPWGNISFQYLMKEIYGVKKVMKGRHLSYSLNGNTIAFSAWMFEAVPGFGVKVGHRSGDRNEPRFMRYTYKKGGYPTTDEIEKAVLPQLIPYKKELEKFYWKSLTDDPAPQPFAFTYNPKSKRNKKAKDDDDEDAEEANVHPPNAAVVAPLTNAQIDSIAEAAAEKVFNKTITKMKELLQQYHTKVIDDVAEKVGNKLLGRGPDYLHNEDDALPSFYSPPLRPCAGTSKEAEHPDTNTGAAATGVTLADIAEAATEIDTALVMAESVLNEPVGVDRSVAMETDTVVAAQGGANSGAAETMETETQEGGGQDEEQDYIITDTQIEQELDALARAEEVTPEQRALVVAMNVRPVRIVYPSRACHSPYLRDDIRPGPQRFDTFMEGEDEMRNVGLFFNVYKEFFNEILGEGSELSDDHVDAYLSILTSRPDMAGLHDVNPNIGIMPCIFMNDIEAIFDKMHEEEKNGSGLYDFRAFSKRGPEKVSDHDMERLMMYAEGALPEWGDCVKGWLEYDMIVAVSFSRQGGWTVAEIDFKAQKVILHDAKGHAFGDVDEYQKKCMFIPLLRLMLKILEAIEYYKEHHISRPKKAQFAFKFGALKGREAFRETKAADATLYCMRQVEWIISNVQLPRGLENADKVMRYRRHVAMTIYAHSTDCNVGNDTSIPFNLGGSM